MELKTLELNKESIKNLKAYTDSELGIFSDNFWTEMYNINCDVKLKKYTIENTLKGMSGDIFDNVKKLFNQPVHKNIESLLDFIKKLRDYLASDGGKDWDKEYELAQVYWKVANDLNDRNVVNFNEWLSHTQKHTYTNQKGWKK